MIFDAVIPVPRTAMAKFASFFVPADYKEVLGELKAAARYTTDHEPKSRKPIAASFTYEHGILVIGPPGKNICHIGADLDTGDTRAAALYELARMIFIAGIRVTATVPLVKHAACQDRFKLDRDTDTLAPREHQVSVGFDDVGMCHVGSHFVGARKDLRFASFLSTAILSPHELDAFVGI